MDKTFKFLAIDGGVRGVFAEPLITNGTIKSLKDALYNSLRCNRLQNIINYRTRPSYRG